MTDKQASAFEETNGCTAEREALDPVAVYEALKADYPAMILMEPCHDYEFPVLYGDSPLGKCALWDNGREITFRIFRLDEACACRHPADKGEAVGLMTEFMEGRLR